jgi:hypothetical protein
MTVAVAQPAIQPVAMQGVAIPAAIVDKNLFLARTRRHIQQERKIAFSVGGATPSTQDVIPLRRSDILSEINLHVVGSLTITPGTGTVATTAEWPYNLFKSLKLNANGASALISARGWTLRAREMAKDEGLSDRGNTQTIGGTPRSNGTLSLASESWGVGSNTTGLGAQTVPVDFVVTVPVAEDPFDLTGSLFLQQTSSELSLEINWAQQSDLFALTGNGAQTFSGTVSINTTKFEVPTQDGAIIVPDLSMFHSLVETNAVNIAAGENETVVVGQGRGKYILRLIQQLYSNGAPVALTAANFGLIGWRFGTAETPDQWIDGSMLRIAQERAYNSDLGGLLGFGVHEFAKAGFRDLVDMGTTADLRLVNNVINAPTNPKLWYAVESLYKQGQAA